MKAGMLIAAMTGSGILGGIVGALLVQGPSAPPSPAGAGTPAAGAPDRDEALSREVADLRARLEEMQGAVTASAHDSSKIKAELEREQKVSALARDRIESLEKGDGAPSGAELALPLGGEMGAVPIQVGRFTAGNSEMSARMKKTLELMRKPEEERWTAIREALNLSSVQEEELKAAIKERDTAMRDMTKIESHEVTGPDGSTSTFMSVSSPDPEKMRETRTKYDDRVNASLTTDQAKKWRDDGYEAAAGGGMASTMVMTTVDTTFGEPAK